MLTLEKVKEHLRIDFADNDDFLKLLISGATARASAITGVDYSYEPMPYDIEMAILEDISQAYAGGNFDKSIHIYRQHSTRPMI